jgi:hypothetical protein
VLYGGRSSSLSLVGFVAMMVDDADDGRHFNSPAIDFTWQTL